MLLIAEFENYWAELSCIVTVLVELAKLWGKSDHQALPICEGSQTNKACQAVREVRRTSSARLWGKSDQQDLTSFKGSQTNKICWTEKEVRLGDTWRTCEGSEINDICQAVGEVNKTSHWRTRRLLRVAARRYWNLRAGSSTIGSPGTVPVSLSVGAWCVL